MQLSLALPKSPLPASTTHTSSFLIKAPSIKQGEVLLLAGGMGNGTFFLCNLKSWHAYFTLAQTHWTTLSEPLHIHTPLPAPSLLWANNVCMWETENKDAAEIRASNNQTNNIFFRFKQSSLSPQQTANYILANYVNLTLISYSSHNAVHL